MISEGSLNFMIIWICFSFCQIQDVDDPLTDCNRESTNSLSPLDVPEKQLQFQDSFQVAELVYTENHLLKLDIMFQEVICVLIHSPLKNYQFFFLFGKFL